MRILIIGDSWVDYLQGINADKHEQNEHSFELVCIPGATMFTIQPYLELEIEIEKFDLCVCIIGCNGYDSSLSKNYPNMSIIRNDILAKQMNIKGYPNTFQSQQIIQIIHDVVSGTQV